MLPPFLNCASIGPRSVKQGLILVFLCYCQATVIFLIDYLTFLAQKSWNSQTLNCRNIINLLSTHKISVKGAVWPVPDFPFRKAMYYGRKGKPHSALLEQTKWANLDEIKSDHLLKTEIVFKKAIQGDIILVELHSGYFCTVFLFYKYLCPHLKLMFGVDVCDKISHTGPAWWWCLVSVRVQVVGLECAHVSQVLCTSA